MACGFYHCVFKQLQSKSVNCPKKEFLRATFFQVSSKLKFELHWQPCQAGGGWVNLKPELERKFYNQLPVYLFQGFKFTIGCHGHGSSAAAIMIL
eukprot:634878-Rhodomonas_salina.3